MREVFDHWAHLWDKRAPVLDKNRARVIADAIASHGVERVKRALEGYTASPHHRGENERETVYDEIELHLRDAKRIEAGLRFADRTRTRPRAPDNWLSESDAKIDAARERGDLQEVDRLRKEQRERLNRGRKDDAA